MEVVLLDNSFIYITNKSGPNSDTRGTTEFIFLQSQV